MGHTGAREAVIYVRISRDRSGEELGVNRQREDCIALAEQLGWRVVAIHTDNDLTAYSGKPRPGFQAMLADITEGRATAVIAWHVDRLYRHPRDLETFVETCEKHKVLVRTARAGELDLSTDAGRMVARILGAVARQEVERSTDRIRRSKVQAAEQGKYRGGPRPFGYESDGMTVRPDEAEVVRDMTKRIVAGEPLRAIARDLNEAGITTSGGKPFTSIEVRRIVQRGRNVALIEVQTATRPRRTILGGPAQWPAIVEQDLWQQAQDLLNDPTRTTTINTGERRHLLTGIALCGVCLEAGDRVPVRIAQGGRGDQVVPVYTCTRAKHLTRVKDLTEAYITEVMARWLARPEAAQALATDPQADPVAVLAEVEKIGARIEEVRAMFTDGIFDAEQTRDSVEKLRAREQELMSSLGHHGDGTPALTLDMIRAGWNALTLVQQRAIVRRFATVVLLPSPKGRPKGWVPGQPYFRPDTISITLGA